MEAKWRRVAWTEAGLLEDGANQRKTVGVGPGRGEAQHDVARADVGAWQHGVTLDGTDGEAGKIELAAAVQSWHLGGLAADQRTAACLAGGGDAAHHQRRLGDVQPAGRIIIEEEQRLGTLDHEVVDAHRHQILADPFEPAGLARQQDFRADAIRGRHQQRVAIAAGGEIEQAAEAAEACGTARSVGGSRQRLDPVDQRVAGSYIDAGLGVAVPARRRLSQFPDHA